MSQEEIKTSHVTQFLRFAIGLGLGAYTTDEAGYVLDRDGTKFTLQDGRAVLLYQEQIKDHEALVLNPFSEGIKESEANKWFYKMQRIALTVRVLQLMKTVLTYAVEGQKRAGLSAAELKAQKLAPQRLPPALRHLVSTIVKDVDVKMLTEYEALEAHALNPATVEGLLYLLYAKKMLTTRLQVSMIEDGDDYEIPKGIRKGTIPVFRTLLMAILGLKSADDIGKFTAKAHEDATPKIDSQMRCLFRLYDQINPALDTLDSEYPVDLSEFKHHLNRLPAYSQNARAMITIAPPPKQTAPQTIPGVAPQFPSAPPSSTTSGGHGKGLPSYVRTDGTWGPEIPATPAPSYGYTGAPMPMQPQMGSWNTPMSAAPAMPGPMMGYGSMMQPAGPMMTPTNPYGAPIGMVQQPPYAAAPRNPYGYPVGPGLPQGFR